MRRLHAIASKRSFLISVGVVLFPLALAVSPAAAVPHNATIASMNSNTRDIFAASMEWGDKYFDPAANLILAPGYSLGAATPRRPVRYHTVRESSWYALGLFMRDKAGDRERADQILAAVLAQQYHEPGKPYDGTFRRAPEEPYPPQDARMWHEFDPNWREFIGTTFAVILSAYGEELPAELKGKLQLSIQQALTGEMHEKRLLPSYTNIALMYGSLLDFASTRLHRSDWTNTTIQWNDSVYRLFKQYNAFNEYNSPTYCGTDLYGLALWRTYGSTAEMRARGSEMEAALWRDMAALYNSRLRNISGPYDRAYGMDMESYVSIVGLWLRTELDPLAAPIPKLVPPLDHNDDLFFVPMIVLPGTRIPPDAMLRFRGFQGERQFRRQITEDRIATAWIGKDVIYGGESTRKTRDSGPQTEFHQFHPATVQWRTPSGQIGWILVMQSPPIDASADRSGLTISASGDVRIQISAPFALPSNLRQGKWLLPGLTVQVASDAKGFTLDSDSLNSDSPDPDSKDGFIYVTYTGMTKMKLSFDNTAQ